MCGEQVRDEPRSSSHPVATAFLAKGSTVLADGRSPGAFGGSTQMVQRGDGLTTLSRRERDTSRLFQKSGPVGAEKEPASDRLAQADLVRTEVSALVVIQTGQRAAVKGRR